MPSVKPGSSRDTSPVQQAPSPKHSRSSSGPRSDAAASRSSAPMTFFIKSEHELQSEGRLSPPKGPENSSFGVESLQDTISTADSLDASRVTLASSGIDDDPPSMRQSKPTTESLFSPQPETSSAPRSVESSPRKSPAHGAIFGKPLTLPLISQYANTPGTDSAPISTPKSASIRSFQLSDDELSSADSQAIASSGDEEEDDAALPPPSRAAGRPDTPEASSAPQLVMPSIKMPSRRPFTEKGKQIGKLKVMVVGSQGVGKTSLIRSILQTSEDIVHVDNLSQSGHEMQRAPTITPRSSRSSHGATGDHHFTEIHASTRAYPKWWSDADEGRPSRRKKSNSEPVLERNICFIDTPGFTNDSSFLNGSTSIIQHIEGLLHRTASFPSMSDNELLGLLSGNGGVRVDLVLFVFSHDGVAELGDKELSFIRHLSKLTNVVPVIGKTDTLDEDQITAARSSLTEKLTDAQVKTFDLGRSASLDNSRLQDLPEVHFAVSSAFSRDDDNMDASLLMNSEYIQPLAPSQLNQLVSYMFDPDNAAWLRHSSSRKFLQWRVTAPVSTSLNTIRPQRMQTSPQFAPTSSVPGGVLITSPSTTTTTSTSSSIAQQGLTPYTLARLSEHTSREERLAQVHLARWATDLQHALHNERARFAAIHDSERTAWLHDRLQEQVTPENGAMIKRKDTRVVPMMTVSRDPLGLLEMREHLQGRGIVIAKVLGSAGILGAVAVFIMRNFGWSVDGVEGWFGARFGACSD